MSNFLLSLNIVWSIICILLYLMAGTNPATFWLFSISSLIVPILFLINLVIILFWLFINWKNIWLPILTIIMGWTHLSVMFSFKESSNNPKCDKSGFSVMSYNIYGLKILKDTTDNSQFENKSKFISFLRKYNPDVLCVQENNFYSDAVINSTGLFPYYHFLYEHGAAIYSKHPIMDKGIVEFGTKTNSCLWSDILINGKLIKVYSLHLQSNQVSRDIEKVTDEEKEDSKSKLRIIKSMFKKYKDMAIIRSNQIEHVLKQANNSTLPTIIAGDMNDTPFSYSYNKITEYFKDSFLECGSGIGSTFVGPLPGLRIDFVFGNKKHINFCSHRVLQTSFSDHNPIFTKLYSRY